MSELVIGNTELAATKQDLVAALVQRTLVASSKLGGLFTDVSMYAVKGSKSISFPYRSARFAVQKRASGQAGSTQELVYANDQLALDENYYISWIIENFDNLQSVIDAETDSISDAAAAHGEQFDKDAFKELIDSADADNNVTFSTAVTKENITEMIQKLDEQNVPEDMRSLIIRPVGKKQIMDIGDFVNANKLGSDRIVSRGQIGELYGVPVVMSNLWPAGYTTTRALMAHREALVYGFQSGPQLGDAPALEYGVGSKRFAMDQLLGFKAMQSGKFISKLIG